MIKRPLRNLTAASILACATHGAIAHADDKLIGIFETANAGAEARKLIYPDLGKI